MKTLGFVGTAKNTGKTTTALHILNLVSAAGIRTALTSIGYDGENNDHVTGLPKPRYFAEPGTLVATARRCLDYGTAQYSSILPTGLNTILGEVVIAAVSQPGSVVVAGPNRRVDIQKLLDQLRVMDVDLAMVDGALNRLAPMVLVDGIVLSTGAALEPHIPTIAEHAAAMESLFHYPGCAAETLPDANLIGYTNAAGETFHHAYNSMLDPAVMQTVAGWFHEYGPGICSIPGACDPQLFQQMLQQEMVTIRGSRFIFRSPVNLIASGSPVIWQACFAEMERSGCSIVYTTPTPLCFLTVNPFYPQYLQKTGSYIPAFVEKTELLQAASSLVRATPVIDIFQPPHPDLLALCGLRS